MGLQRRTIQKLLREDFSGATPLVVAQAERKKLGSDIKARLERIEGVETKDHGFIREEEKPRFVCSFSLHDPQSYYYYATYTRFELVLDGDGRLIIKQSHGGSSAPVSDLDEVVLFARHCKERLERHKALHAKRGKVRGLLAQAILAQVRKLAKEERFDFMSDTDAQKLKLYVKLSDEHAVALHIPFKEFKEFLPQLRSAIVNVAAASPERHPVSDCRPARISSHAHPAQASLHASSGERGTGLRRQ
jgi:hypothetical protein